MHSWEVVCIEVDEDSEFEDCRAITTIGYRAPSLKKKSADVVGARIHQDHSDFHVVVDGDRVPLQAASDPAVNFYARTLEEDDTDDPLLALESCTDHELDERLDGIA